MAVLTEEQSMLKDAAKSWVQEKSPVSAFRKMRDSGVELGYDSALGKWRFNEPNWDEFYRVIRGGGPCNMERVALRRFSYEQGRWVRQAVMGVSSLPPCR